MIIYLIGGTKVSRMHHGFLKNSWHAYEDHTPLEWLQPPTHGLELMFFIPRLSDARPSLAKRSPHWLLLVSNLGDEINMMQDYFVIMLLQHYPTIMLVQHHCCDIIATTPPNYYIYVEPLLWHHYYNTILLLHSSNIIVTISSL